MLFSGRKEIIADRSSEIQKKLLKSNKILSMWMTTNEY